MIASLTGTVSQVVEDSLVVSISGLGLRVYVPSHLRNRLGIGDPIELQTYLVVRGRFIKPVWFRDHRRERFFCFAPGSKWSRSPDCFERTFCAQSGCHPESGRQRDERCIQSCPWHWQEDGSKNFNSPPGSCPDRIPAGTGGVTKRSRS